nr:hypothetical protein [Pseudarthrobacter sulfonivorans]
MPGVAFGATPADLKVCGNHPVAFVQIISGKVTGNACSPAINPAHSFMSERASSLHQRVLPTQVMHIGTTDICPNHFHQQATGDRTGKLIFPLLYFIWSRQDSGDAFHSFLLESQTV